MNFRFRHRNALEDGKRVLFHKGREVAFLD
jgi:hypothetical protein